MYIYYMYIYSWHSARCNMQLLHQFNSLNSITASRYSLTLMLANFNLDHLMGGGCMLHLFIYIFLSAETV